MLEKITSIIKFIPAIIAGLLGIATFYFKSRSDSYEKDLKQSEIEKSKLEEQAEITEEAREIDKEYHDQDSEIRNDHINDRVDLGVYDDGESDNK